MIVYDSWCSNGSAQSSTIMLRKARLHKRFLSRNSTQLQYRGCNYLPFKCDFAAAISPEFRACLSIELRDKNRLCKRTFTWTKDMKGKYLLLTDFEGGTVRFVIYSTDRENEDSKIFITSLYLGIKHVIRDVLNLGGRRSVEYGPQN